MAFAISRLVSGRDGVRFPWASSGNADLADWIAGSDRSRLPSSLEPKAARGVDEKTTANRSMDDPVASIPSPSSWSRDERNSGLKAQLVQ